MDYDKEFEKLTERLGDLGEEVADDAIAISLLDISMVLERINEAAFHIGRYISKVISVPRGTPVNLPVELAAHLPALGSIAEEVADVLHDFLCDECGDDCDCPEGNCSCEEEDD